MHYSTHLPSSPSVAKAHVEHEALLRGQVVSIVSGYGFIRDNQGVSYYFNPGKVDKGQVYSELKPGMAVVFEAKAGPRGMVASRVKAVPLFEGIEVPSRILSLRDGKTLRDGEKRDTSSLVCVRSAWHRSPNDAMNELMQVVQNAEANLAEDVTLHKQTFSEGNYNYTMHSFSAWCGLYWRPLFTDNEDEAKSSKSNLSNRIADSAMYLEHEANRLQMIRKKQESNPLIGFVIFVIVLIFVAAALT